MAQEDITKQVQSVVDRFKEQSIESLLQQRVEINARIEAVDNKNQRGLAKGGINKHKSILTYKRITGKKWRRNKRSKGRKYF